MKILPYKLASFEGTMVTLVVDAEPHAIVALSNRVSFIDAKVWAREEFEHDYRPADLNMPALELTLQQFQGYSRSVGCTARAGVYLNKLGVMKGKDLHDAIIKGEQTLARIKKEAERMAQADNAEISGKAPRKLAGAAAAAVKRKEERLAAEAKKLAGEVTSDKVEEEANGTADARLPNTPVKRSRPKKQAAESGDKTPAVAETTPKTKKEAKKILQGDKPARKDSQVLDGKFDPAKLMRDGEYRSASSMFKGLLFEGKLTDEQIAKQVGKKFGLDDQKAKDYVKWNRGWFRREGIKISDPK